LSADLKWHLVADPVNAVEWETLLRAALNEPVKVIAPPAAVELAGRTAKRAAAAGKINLLPAEFTARYHQQFIDRLWLRGLAYAGVAYAVLLAVYFCAVSFRGYQTHNVEGEVAKISVDYTNAMELKAKFAVLSERAQLKYAALDCWQLVAQMTPASVSLQRMSFADGKKLALGGNAPMDQVNTLFDYNSAMKKASLNGQPAFDRLLGDTVSPKAIANNQVAWNFSLELLRTEAEQP
jgi:hypothetical protein